MYKIIISSILVFQLFACVEKKQSTTSTNQSLTEIKEKPEIKEKVTTVGLSEKPTMDSTKTITKNEDKEIIENLSIADLQTELDTIKTKMKNGEAIKIVCYGNSITNGYKVNTYTTVKNPYPEVLEKLLQKHYKNNNISVINEGHNGWRVDQAFNALEKLVLSKKPDLVTLMYGINDAYAKYSSQKFKRFLKDIITKLKSKKIKILLLSPTPINRPENAQVQQFVKVMQTLAKEENVAFYNVHQKILDRKALKGITFQQLLPDEIHFGDDYYAWIAESILSIWLNK